MPVLAYNSNMATIKNCYIKMPGMRTRYLCAGEAGPPVILVHGLGASAEIWKDNIGPLAESHRVYAPDLVGFGHTDKPDIKYNPQDFILFLKGFMDAVGLEKASLVGLSLGGGIALLFTIEYPARVEKLVLVDSAGLGPEMTLPMKLGSMAFFTKWLKFSKPMLASGMKRLVYNQDVVTEGLVDLYYKMLAKPDAMRTVSRVLSSVATLAGARKDVLGLIRERLHTIDVPTLIVWGREDRIIPLKHGIQGQEQIRGARLYIFDACGHIPNLEKPAEFNRIVLDFLDRT